MRFLFKLIIFNCFIFVSSKEILNFNLFILLIPFYVIYWSKFFHKKINLTGILVILLFLVITSLNLYNFQAKVSTWIPFALLNLAPICFLLSDLDNFKMKITLIEKLIFEVFIIAFSIFAFLNIGNRLHLVFGPNVIYKIIGFNYLIWLFVFSLKNNRFYNFIIKCLFLLIMIKVGSRGGVLLFLTVNFHYYFIIYKRLSYFKLFISLIPIIIITVIYFYDFLRLIFGRTLYFDINNQSESFRLKSIKDFFSWLDNSSFFDFIIGSGLEQDPFMRIYPHNIFIELIHGYGILVGIIFLILIINFFHTQNNLLKLILYNFLLGSVFSGSLLDNFIIFSILFFPILNPIKNKFYKADPNKNNCVES